MSNKDQEDIDELFPPPILDLADYTNVVILDGLPIIPHEKEEKLTQVLQRILTQLETKVVSIFMPFSSGNSLGYAFIEFINHEHAKTAVQSLNNYKLDKSHTFKTNFYEDFATYDKFPSVYKPPEHKHEPFENLYDWLEEPTGRDQFALRYGKDIEVMWHGSASIPPSSVTKQTLPSDQYIMWSPKGTYLVILHPFGVILCGGPEWKKLKRIAHKGVELVQFSPNEKYLVTCSNKEPDEKKQQQGEPQTIIIWDLKTGHKLRGFQKLRKTWPEFQWSHDDKYFSRVDNGFIYIFETPSMALIEVDGVRKPIKLHGRTTDHGWSPSDNLLCAYVPEFDSIPARVVLLEIPSRKIVGDRALFNVNNCIILWQDKGDYLAVKVDRHGKSKKKIYTAFEFFRIREKDIPVEDMKLSDTVLAFAWEPKGHKFALIHSIPESTLKNVSFYDMVGGTKVRKLDTLEKRSLTHLSWSPRGRFIVLTSGENFEFYDAETQETMAKDQKHVMANYWTWDPTGRYFTTFVSGWKHKSELGFKVWSFKGNELWSVLKEGFLQFEWRPRPPTLLPPEQLKELNENSEFFKKFRQRYKEEDKIRFEARMAEEEKRKEQMKAEWRQYFREKREEWEKDTEWRKKADLEDEELVTVEEVVEEVVEVKEELAD